ncbi:MULTISPECIES: hypothetical protein [unclassified Microbacterium]|uniref:hypothetical protein n=1 Tax=unclassified Microbacterium TaxID=2609290 RepID=UPI0012F7951E|nr:hypothetical protein [Microbacterium sp. MAH-37]MVQ44126.1 hypothetical protein [Microbacterium sp. MAH-37]
MTTVFEDAALRARVDPALARQESRERVVREGRQFGVVVGSGWVILQSVVLVVGAGVLAALAVLVVQLMSGADGADATTFVLAALMVVPLAVARIRSHLRGPREREAEEYRLARFAEANGLSYETGQLDPERSAALFGVGTSRVATDIIGGAAPRPFEVANYSFDTWAARARLPRAANYVAFESRGVLPAMTIKTKAPVASSAWEPAAPQERVQIEGEFASRFEVFTARATADAVRHLLSAEVQAAITALAAPCDIEVTDDRVFVIARRHLSMTDPTYWEWVADLASLVALIEGRGRGEQVVAFEDADSARSTRREALFAAPRAGRAGVIGCLIPLVIGLAAAALITRIALG